MLVEIASTAAGSVVRAGRGRLTASVLSDSRIALSWRDNSSDEAAFAVWRGTGSGPFARIALLPPNSTGYTDRDLTPGLTYAYRVRAIGLGGASDWSNDAVGVAQNPAVAPPTFLSAQMGAGAAAQLVWSDNSPNANAFAIWRQGAGAGWARVGVAPPDRTRFTDSGLLPGTTYTYRVRAISGAVASAWSNEAILNTPARPTAPTDLTAPTSGPTVVLLRWTVQGADETGLTIWRKQSSGDWAAIGELPPGSTLFFDTGVSPRMTYTYRVQAHNNSFVSDWSNEVSITVPAVP